jgi:hypothetical protein
MREAALLVAKAQAVGRASVLSPKYEVLCCDQNGPPARSEEGAYLDRYVTDEQRSRRPIFIATLWAGASWLFFRVARSTRMTKIWALRSRLEKQPTDLRQSTSYFGDRTLEEFTEERRRFLRDADDLVRCLTIEFEIELGRGLAVIPVGEMFELAPPQRPLRERGASDGEADTRCLPGDAALLRDRFGRSDHAARDEALPALVLAREDKDRVAFGDMLTAVHRLLRGECERPRPRIANLGFDRERHASPFPPSRSVLTNVEPSPASRYTSWACCPQTK